MRCTSFERGSDFPINDAKISHSTFRNLSRYRISEGEDTILLLCAPSIRNYGPEPESLTSPVRNAVKIGA